MSDLSRWRQFWEEKSKGNVLDFEVDRLRPQREQGIEDLSQQELVNFIDVGRFETLLDAGCGTGVNILRLYTRVRNIIGIDYAWGSLERCRKRIQAQQITNVQICLASVAAIPLPNSSVDRVLCLSVLQYLDDDEASKALKELVRVLAPGGTIILHVKNSSSLYWSTLRLAKQIKVFLGWGTRLEYVRPFQWYADELAALNCYILDYNSLNLLVVEGIPNRMLSLLQGFELRHHDSPIFRAAFVRRHGAELKIKAKRVEGGLKPRRTETKARAPLSR